MNLFNARLDLQSVSSSVTPNVWEVVCKILDLSGTFFAVDAKAGNIIYMTGLDNDSGAMAICRYKVLSVDQAKTTADLLYANISIDDCETIQYEPQLGYEGIIGEISPSGFVALSSPSNGISQSLIETARNMDIFSRDRLGKIGSAKTSIKRKIIKIIDSTTKIFDLESIIENSDIVTLNGMILTPDLDYSLNDNKLIVNSEIQLYSGDILVIKYSI